MAISMTFTLVETCASGGHAFVSRVVDGGGSAKMTFNTDELRSPLSPDEKEQFSLLAIRASLAGLTRAQARNKLAAGITVVVV